MQEKRNSHYCYKYKQFINFIAFLKQSLTNKEPLKNNLGLKNSPTIY